MGSIAEDLPLLATKLHITTNKNTHQPTPAPPSIGFAVTAVKKELVAAVLPVQEHWLPLSNLDLLLPPVDVGVFFCYPHGGGDALLKKGLAQALVSYYAFAGELVMSSGGEPELLCNNRGVEFSEAYADVALRELDLYNPDDSVEGKLVPLKNGAVLAVQVTKLRCGGLVVGCSFDHRIADAYSFNMFLVSWAESAQSRPISTLPSFRRSLLNPRRPLSHNSAALDDMYIPVSSLPPPPSPPPSSSSPVLISRIYHVSSDSLLNLQSLANTNNNNNNRFSKLESFCAYLWQLVARSTLGNDDVVSKMGIVVDGRSRLGPQMGSYVGNVLSIPYGGERVGELVGNSLGHVAGGVHEFLAGGASRDHFLGLIDWVEAHRPEPAVSKIYSAGNADGPAFVVSSGRGLPVGRVDFGFGLPVFGSYHFPWGGAAGYVMPMPCPKGNGDWVVYMHLFEEQLELIEREAAAVFRPFAWDYVVV